jgi:AbrB family looped-hinge helix DNA binding protein
MREFTTVTSKGQITIPSEMRAALHLKAGVKVQVRLAGSVIQVEAVPDLDELKKQNLLHLKSLARKSKSAHIKEENAGRDGAVVRYRRGR